MQAKVYNTDKYKAVESPKYNYLFDKQSGACRRWSDSASGRPEYSPFGPEVLGISVMSQGNIYTEDMLCRSRPMEMTKFKELLTPFLRLNSVLTTVVLYAKGIGAYEWMLRAYITHVKKHNINVEVVFGYSDLNEKTQAALKGVDVCNIVARREDNLKKVFSLYPGTMETTYGFFVGEDIVDQLIELPPPNSLVMFYSSFGESDVFEKAVAWVLENNIPFGFDPYLSKPFSDYLIKKAKHHSQLLVNTLYYDGGLFSAFIDFDGKLFPCAKLASNPNYKHFGIDYTGAKEPDQIVIWHSMAMTAWRAIIIGQEKSILEIFSLDKKRRG
jgi:hypothetical protein